MNRFIATSLVSATLILGTATTALGQASGNQWRQGTALAVFAGGASAAGGTGVASGMSIGWQFTPRLEIEGSGLWVNGAAVDTFTALIESRLNLLPRRVVVPFVSGGAGLHKASVESNATGIPNFFLRRLPPSTAETSRHEQTFDDFVAAFGGGSDVFVTHHIAVRPEVSVRLVHAAGEIRAVTVYGVHLAYHFQGNGAAPTRHR